MSVKIRKHFKLLGCKVEDKVTGMKGVVSSLSFDLYGCVQGLVKPPVDKDGKDQDARWYDVSRLKIVNKKPVMKIPEFDYNDDKGPARKPIF